MLINAQEEQLEAVWNEIVGLLGIRHTESSYGDFLEDLRNLNDWMLREYPNITCEELRLAYNMAVKDELDIEKLIPVLAPKYVGEIIGAYRRKVNNDPEVMSVYRSQQHIDPPVELTPEEGDAYMENAVLEAVKIVQQGLQYPDLASAMYDWLDSKGRISFNREQKIGFWNQAIDEIAWSVANGEPTTLLMHPTDRAKRVKDIASLMTGILTPTQGDRIRVHAKMLALNHYLVSLIPESEVIVTVSKLKSTANLF